MLLAIEVSSPQQNQRVSEYTGRNPMKAFRARLILFGLIVASLALVACGSSGGGATTVVTVVEKTSSSSAGSGADTGTAEAATSAADSVSDEGTGGNDGGGEITVPNEVGKNHQAAQDDLQAHGLYNLSEEDATGQGRMLILDRNWKVVSQSPEAGTKVAEDATITLRSKKYTD